MEEKNVENVIAYASTPLSKVAINWTTTEKACYAIVYAIKQFHYFIHGYLFCIVSDYSGLQWLMSLKDTAAAALMYYLKYARYQPGTSTKQCKHVKNLATQFSLIGAKLLYKKNKTDKYLIYPKRDEREQLIKKEHQIDHFASESVCNSLKIHYFWRNMIKQIFDVISRCETCYRNDRARIVHHPALALDVSGIFDRVGLDLVLGLTETDGFKGILTICEFLSNFVVIIPNKVQTSQ